MELTVDRLRKLVSYDPETGIFVRRTTGKTLGYKCGPNKYLAFYLNGRRHYAHRLAWFYVHAVWPSADIDHINRSPRDNRLVNLRLATRSQNQANTRRTKKSKTGYKGVFRDRGRWAAQISHQHKKIAIGTFGTSILYFAYPRCYRE